jgi:hypothetical protein
MPTPPKPPIMKPPLFKAGDRVYIAKIDKHKRVVEPYLYKEAEWAYTLIEDDGKGLVDEGWREDELTQSP